MASPSSRPSLDEHALDALGAEDAHQVVFQGQEELGRPGVALATGAAAQLVIDAAAFVAFGAQDKEAAGGDHLFLLFRHLGAQGGDASVALGAVGHVVQFLADAHVRVAAKLDVGAAARHVGGDGHRAKVAGLGDDIGLLFVIAGVEDLVLDVVFLEQGRQVLGLLDGDGADQDRLAALLAVRDELQDGVVLLGHGAVHLVVEVFADTRQVGGDVHHLELVDFRELACFRHRGAGHAGQLGVEPEVILKGDRGQGLVLVLNGDLFLGLEGLVQAFRIAPSLHHAAGELVDDNDLVVLDDVVGVAREQRVGAQRLIGVVDQRDVGDVVQAALAQHLPPPPTSSPSFRCRPR